MNTQAMIEPAVEGRCRRRVRVAQIGVGRWGINILRNLLENPLAEVVAICENSPIAREKAVTRSAGLEAMDSVEDLVNRRDIEVVCVATPADRHFEHAAAALNSGKHVFVEKPMATSMGQALELVRLADETNRLLVVGHIFLFNSVVMEVKRHITEGDLGDVYFAHSRRLNLGGSRRSCDLVWTLAPHDVAIFNYWFDSRPERVCRFDASGAGADRQGGEDCHARLFYPNGMRGRLHLSWQYPRKVRRAVVVGTRGTLVYDDMNAERPIEIFDEAIHPEDVEIDGLVAFMDNERGDHAPIRRPFPLEPLYAELDAFLNCVLDERPSRTDGHHGVEVLAVLDALTRSLREGGREITVEYPDLRQRPG